ncbi:M81 family metallopeptidase [Microvirga roseola]|uniref:M81 family metallopeptidase n=1 Tax=Microvirga roseola TaxID=2883126 RepID=UPI001E474833|nr:M81 family metallopeptidase [Microvirga roseola]
MTGPRVAIGGFMHETNTFGPSKAGLEAFVEGGGWPSLSEGPALINATRNVNMGICGFVEAAEAQGWDTVPTLWCAASPSAHVTENAFETITNQIVDGIRSVGRLDGVYLDLHGAMVAEHVDDGEGEILTRIRDVIGPDVPLVASLDLHANATRRMFDMADALIAYRTYPHVDMAETGRRSALYLRRLMSGERDAKAFRQVPFLIPIAWQCTSVEPGRSLYARLPALEERGIGSASLLMGFPAADFADCGPSIVVYAPSQEIADKAADDLLRAVAEQESAFSGRVYSPREGVLHAMKLADSASRPVVIADTQDNPGAGGDSDTTGMLRALVEADAKRAAIGAIVDPLAAIRAHEAGIGARVRLSLGGKSGIEGDAPLEADYVVESLSDGHLTASGPFYGGARMQLGPSACLRLGDVRIVIASRKAQMADQEMYRFVGIEPTKQAILVNKSSVHFRADFEPIAEAVLVCAAPGPMPVDPAALPFTRLRKGMRLSPNGPFFN